MLGFSDHEAMNTPIPRLVVAYKAKIKWVRMCNGEDVRPAAQKIADQLRKVGK